MLVRRLGLAVSAIGRARTLRPVSVHRRRRSLALLAVPLAIAGCGGSGSPSSPNSSSDNAAHDAAPALSEQQYQALVDDGANAVKASLSSVRGAGSRSGLHSRLEKSAAKLEKAAATLTAIK